MDGPNEKSGERERERERCLMHPESYPAFISLQANANHGLDADTT